MFEYFQFFFDDDDGGRSPCFGSGGLASLGGNAARPIFNAVAICVKCEP